MLNLKKIDVGHSGIVPKITFSARSLFLEKLAKKYDFPLSQQKAARWVDKYINVMLKIQTSTQKNPLLNLIKSDTMCSSKIAVFCAVEQFQKKI